MSEENKNINENESEETVVESETEACEQKTEEMQADEEKQNSKANTDSPESEPKKQRKERKISLSTFIISTIAIVLATVMITFTVAQSMYKGGAILGGGLDQDEAQSFDELEFLDAFFKTFSYYDLNDEEILEAVMKAYADATGDVYAEYYTQEEYEAMMSDSSGNSEGIGITIIYSTVEYMGGEYDVMKVVSVLPESPALKAGVRSGDIVFFVGTDKSTRQTVDSLGADKALSMLQGKAGTKAQFTVLRMGENGEYEEIPFEVTRGYVKTESVMYHVCTTDNSVGIVKITEFDLSTPKQFSDAVDALLDKGVKKFVFDVRYNGGGDLRSIVAVLSYFLDEGQTILSTVDKAGNSSVTKVKAITDYTGDAADCNVYKKDIGKYKDLDVAVLCNSSTASAAELFTATFRDYNLGKVVGEKTYGKGSMQTIYSLAYFGYDGAVKLTTNMYFPPCGEGYDGIGITPDIVEKLSEKAASTNIYELSDADDNQLQKAIQTFN